MKIKLVMALMLFFSWESAFAKTCKVEIDATDGMQYSTKEIKVSSSCTKVELTLKHVGKLPKSAMGHNWILVDTKDFQAKVTEAMQATLAKDYEPKESLAATKLIGGGESSTVTIDMKNIKKGGDYTYFCGFPGHSALMNGKFIVE